MNRIPRIWLIKAYFSAFALMVSFARGYLKMR